MKTSAQKKYSFSLAVFCISIWLSGFLIDSVRSETLNFNFTITSQYYYNYSNYYSYTAPQSYTLNGEIIGLQNNSTSAPSDVLLFNTIFPSGGGLTGFIQKPYSLKDHGFTEVGDFIVTNSAITGTSDGGVSFNYFYDTLSGSGNSSYNFEIWDNFYFNGTSKADGTNGASGISNVNGQNGGSGNFYSDASYYGGEEAYNLNGFRGTTYTLAVAPEPGTGALFFGGLALLIFWRSIWPLFFFNRLT